VAVPPYGAARADDGGFFSHATAFVSAAFAYLKARLQLAGLEGKRAAVHYLIIVALLVGALGVVVFGYIFLCLAIIFLLSWLFGGGIALFWSALGMALLHFGGAVAAAIIAKNKFSEPMLSATMQEFGKDQEWLNSTTAKQH